MNRQVKDAEGKRQCLPNLTKVYLSLCRKVVSSNTKDGNEIILLSQFIV
ncbi:hypothetical protein [Flavipsychrobacter stenotrophus]|nr:hypothetical protein [Flavipsychrobacter stenotrophus]